MSRNIDIEAIGPHLADQLLHGLVRRWHQATQKRKESVAASGGKAVVKYQPTQAETVAGYKQEVTLVAWQSPDGMPQQVSLYVMPILGSGGTYPAAQDATTGALLSYRPTVEIVLTIAGVKLDPFYIDIGQRITVTASQVFATVRMQQPQAGFISGSMNIAAVLGEQGMPSQAPILDTAFADMPGSTVAVSSAGVVVSFAGPPVNIAITGSPFGFNPLGGQVLIQGVLVSYTGVNAAIPALTGCLLVVNGPPIVLAAGNPITTAAIQIIIPPFGKFLQPIGMGPGVTGSVRLDFVNTVGTVINALSIPNGSQIAPIPMMEDYYAVNVINTTLPYITQFVRLPFWICV